MKWGENPAHCTACRNTLRSYIFGQDYLSNKLHYLDFSYCDHQGGVYWGQYCSTHHHLNQHQYFRAEGRETEKNVFVSSSTIQFRFSKSSYLIGYIHLYILHPPNFPHHGQILSFSKSGKIIPQSKIGPSPRLYSPL